jgi:predicted nucleic acid-binding protein
MPGGERLGARAVVEGLIAATRNVADFEALGVEVVDPWATATR